MTLIFLDTEFTSLTQDTELISLALVSDDGRQFYAVFTEFDNSNLNSFVSDNVIPYLNFSENNDDLYDLKIRGTKNTIKEALKNWLAQFNKIQFWADVPHYDWILFCNIFGGALHIPSHIHYICFDLSTFLLSKEIDIDTPRIELLNTDEMPNNYILHNALSDAQVGMLILKKLLSK